MAQNTDNPHFFFEMAINTDEDSLKARHFRSLALILDEHVYKINCSQSI